MAVDDTADGTYRVSLSLPALQAKLLNAVARRCGCSQSALVSILLEEPVEALASVLGDEPARPPRRWSGPHIDDLRAIIREALAEAHQAGPPLL